MDGVASIERHFDFWWLLSVDDVDFPWELWKGIKIGLMDLYDISDWDVFRVVVYFLHVGRFNPKNSFSLRCDHQVLVVISEGKQINGSLQLLRPASDNSFDYAGGKDVSFDAASVDHIISYSHGWYLLFMELSTSLDDLSTFRRDDS